MKYGVFWDVTPCGSCHPDEGGAKFLRNVGFYKSHTALTSQKTPFFIVTAVKTSNLTRPYVATDSVTITAPKHKCNIIISPSSERSKSGYSDFTKEDAWITVRGLLPYKVFSCLLCPISTSPGHTCEW
jgi:hypothetical protein